MKSTTNKQFRKRYQRLPANVRRQAQKAYKLFFQDPYHPSLHFKQIHPTLPFYSARVSDNYRVVGKRSNNTMIWYWIGTHDEYDRILSSF